MDKKVTALISRSRNINMFGELSHGHWVLLKNAQEQRDGYFFEYMSCNVFAAFKFEAFLNHIGPRLFRYWDELERLPYRKKLAIIVSHLGIDADFGCRPFQTLTDLFRVRDAIAHGKPETLAEKEVVESGTREELRRKMPLTQWESMCESQFAQKAYDDTEEIAELIWKAAGFDAHELRSRQRSYEMRETS